MHVFFGGPQFQNIKYLSDDVEEIQKSAVKIILREKFVDNKCALESLKIETLKYCGFRLIIRFGQSLLVPSANIFYPLLRTQYLKPKRRTN